MSGGAGNSLDAPVPGRAVAAGAVEPVPVSPVPASIPRAVPTLAERNEGYTPPQFDMANGQLGATPILWEFRMAYAWSEQFAEERDEWDQCCTCWVFAVSETEARQKVWGKFEHPHSVMPEAIASCYPTRFRNADDDAKDEYRSASAMSARSDETGTGSIRQDASAAPQEDAQTQSLTPTETGEQGK